MLHELRSYSKCSRPSLLIKQFFSGLKAMSFSLTTIVKQLKNKHFLFHLFLFVTQYNIFLFLHGLSETTLKHFYIFTISCYLKNVKVTVLAQDSQIRKSRPPAKPVACSAPIRGFYLLAPERRTEGLPTAPHPQPPLKGLLQCFLIPAQPLKGLAGLL